MQADQHSNNSPQGSATLQDLWQLDIERDQHGTPYETGNPKKDAKQKQKSEMD